MLLPKINQKRIIVSGIIFVIMMGGTIFLLYKNFGVKRLGPEEAAVTIESKGLETIDSSKALSEFDQSSAVIKQINRLLENPKFFNLKQYSELPPLGEAGKSNPFQPF